MGEVPCGTSQLLAPQGVAGQRVLGAAFQHQDSIGEEVCLPVLPEGGPGPGLWGEQQRREGSRVRPGKHSAIRATPQPQKEDSREALLGNSLSPR